MLKNNKLYTRIWLAFKKAKSVDNLPKDVLKIHNNILVRIYRFISGLSIILIITKYPLDFYLFNLLGFNLILYTLYNLYICYFRIKHTYYIVFKSDELDIKNSPLDKLATQFARIIYCSKTFCDNVGIIGGVLGVTAYYDSLLEVQGKDPIFKTTLAKLIFGDNPENQVNDIRKHNLQKVTKINNEIEFINEVKNLADKSPDTNFTVQDRVEFKKAFEKEGTKLILERDKLIKEIINSLNKNKEFINNPCFCWINIIKTSI